MILILCKKKRKEKATLKIQLFKQTYEILEEDLLSIQP